MAKGGNQEVNPPINTIEELIAHSLVIECEATERYEDMAHAMETHNNRDVAHLLHTLSGYGEKHAEQMRRIAEGMVLPKIAPWDFNWHGGESPESAALEDMHYMMTPYHALRMAHRAEVAARDFYAGVARTTSDSKVRALASEFADEEAEHVRLLEKWIENLMPPEEDWDFDLDPPSMPE